MLTIPARAELNSLGGCVGAGCDMVLLVKSQEGELGQR